MLRTRVAPLALLLTVAVAGCSAPKNDSGGASGSSPAAGSSGSGAGCTPAQLKTVQSGTLTIGTDTPAYEPWFSDNKPSNGKGYESAVGYAIAKKLGYAQDKIRWTTVPFNNAITPGKKNFDIDLNQVSISEPRRKAVDFSTGYYDVTQAVITTKGSAADGVRSVADLKKLKLGAQVGTTSYTAITDQIAPSSAPAVFDSNAQAVQALKSKQVQAIVVDLPTAFYMTAAQLDDGVIVGQLPGSSSTKEQFGAVLTKGSPLTSCVSGAVDALRADGTLKKLEAAWLTGKGAPTLS